MTRPPRIFIRWFLGGLHWRRFDDEHHAHDFAARLEAFGLDFEITRA